MSLSDLASLGSFASGIAVVVSLIILIIQMRQNAHVMIRVESNAAQEQLSNWRLAIANNAELADIWGKGIRDDALTEIEERRFGLLMQDLSFAIFQTWDRENKAMIEANSWRRIAPRLVTLYTTKRGASWWQQNKDLFPPDYALAVDEAIRAFREQKSETVRT